MGSRGERSPDDDFQEATMVRFSALVLLGLGFATAPLAAAPPAPRETLKLARDVLDELSDTPAKAIPKALLDEAEAVVIVPNTIKAGFVVGGRFGHGVAVIRDKDKGWGDIRFIELSGASVGFQVGIQSTDVVLVFKTRKGLERMLEGKAKLKLGADAAVAAGPLGREAQVATDGKLKAEIFSYSRNRGLFAGVSLEGVILAPDTDTSAAFEKDITELTRQAGDELKKRVSTLSVEKKKDKEPEQVVPGAVAIPLPMPVPVEVPAPRPGPLRRLIDRIRG